MLTLYTVFHPVNMLQNTLCEQNVAQYEPVFTIAAKNMSEVFKMCQNGHNQDYDDMDLRSTSVGDIIQSEHDAMDKKCFLIKGTEFEEVSVNWLHHIDWDFVKNKPDAPVLCFSTEADGPVDNMNQTDFGKYLSKLIGI